MILKLEIDTDEITEQEIYDAFARAYRYNEVGAEEFTAQVERYILDIVNADRITQATETARASITKPEFAKQKAARLEAEAAIAIEPAIK